VVTEGGNIKLSTEQVQISESGQISTDGTVLGHLEVAHFDNPSALLYEGNGLFKAAEGSSPSQAIGVSAMVRQGYLEASNVHPLQDTLGLMATSRHLELVSKALTAYDSMLDAALTDLSS
jgi:flagellar basal-body rod protein FlgG